MKTITKSAIFDQPWVKENTNEQHIDLEVFLDWLKETLQGAAPTSDGVRLVLRQSQHYDEEVRDLGLAWDEEQGNKTTTRVKKAINNLQKPKKDKKK